MQGVWLSYNALWTGFSSSLLANNGRGSLAVISPPIILFLVEYLSALFRTESPNSAGRNLDCSALCLGLYPLEIGKEPALWVCIKLSQSWDVRSLIVLIFTGFIFHAWMGAKFRLVSWTCSSGRIPPPCLFLTALLTADNGG